MDMGRKVKVVYVDDGETKVLKGVLFAEDAHTLTIMIENATKKTVMIGKQALVKATYIDERHSQ